MLLRSAYRRFPEKPPAIISIAEESDALGDKRFLRCLGHIIQASRKQRGMTQEALSEIAGVSANYLSEVERGRGNVTVLFLRRVSRALKTDLCALFYACEDHSEERRLKREIADRLQKLQSEELRQVSRILRVLSENENQEVTKNSLRVGPLNSRNSDAR